VAIVNGAFANKFLRSRDPVGTRLNVCWSLDTPVTIIGVVTDVRQKELQTPPEPTIYLDNIQVPMYFNHLVLRSRDDPRQIARSVQAAIHRVDPDQAVSGIQTMQEIYSDSVSTPRFHLMLLLIFAGIAVVLAAIGVYGVVAYSVTQRTQEIGIRMALGAQGGNISRLVLREGVGVGALGIALGLAGAFAATRVLRSLLFEVTPTDPLTLASVAVLLFAMALAAALLPARRAAAVDPVVALRHE
jgi:putative ABC transport system permease protein